MRQPCKARKRSHNRLVRYRVHATPTLRSSSARASTAAARLTSGWPSRANAVRIDSGETAEKRARRTRGHPSVRVEPEHELTGASSECAEVGDNGGGAGRLKCGRVEALSGLRVPRIAPARREVEAKDVATN
eukprot:scaffold7916_cov31-Tisochrysis_lutea.AAC.5